MFYELADIVYEYLVSQSIRVFNQLKSNLVAMDVNELNVFTEVSSSYKEIKNILYDKLLELAEKVYEQAYLGDLDSVTPIDEDWLRQWLDDYDEITKYVFEKEFDRKQDRCFEGIMGTLENPAQQVDTALKQLSRMINQATITITDTATVRAYKDSGVEKVKWITSRDSKVCKICNARDGKIYDIDSIPTKPHIGCRCTIEPYLEDE